MRIIFQFGGALQSRGLPRRILGCRLLDRGSRFACPGTRLERAASEEARNARLAMMEYYRCFARRSKQIR